jgi:hypothetical protein
MAHQPHSSFVVTVRSRGSVYHIQNTFRQRARLLRERLAWGGKRGSSARPRSRSAVGLSGPAGGADAEDLLGQRSDKALVIKS